MFHPDQSGKGGQLSLVTTYHGIECHADVESATFPD
jgi:hypothetical protein